MTAHRKKKSPFSRQHKTDAVQHVASSGKTVAQVTTEPDLRPKDARKRVLDGPPPIAQPKERASTGDPVAQLRRELRMVTVERDFLRRAVAFFAAARR